MNNNVLNLLFLDLPLFYSPEHNVITEAYNNIFGDVIKVQSYDLGDINNGIISINEIDIIFCSDFGYTHYNEAFDDIIKVYFSIEDCIPNLNYVDYAISTYEDNMMGRNYTMPTIIHYMPLYSNIDQHIKNDYEKYNDDELFNRKFASYIVSNYQFCDPKRIRLYDVLNSYKKVYSPGVVNHNCEFSDIIKDYEAKNILDEKREFIKQFKFNLAFENTVSPGYLTEKIGDAFYNMTIPIYYGDSICKKMFNEKAFIDITDMNNEDILINVKDVCENKTKYLDMLYSDKINKTCNNYLYGLYDFLVYVYQNGKKQVVKYGTHKRFQKEIYKLWINHANEVNTVESLQDN